MDDEILIKTRAELDVILLNIEAAVRVKRRSDFFSWVQGVFQGIIAHDVLICVVAEPVSRNYRMDWMSSRPIQSEGFAELCNPGGVIPRLMALWAKRGRLPILCDGDPAHPCFDTGLASELRRLQLDNVAAHGIPDRDGRATSFFSFSKISRYLGQEHATRLELMVPYLHAAWAQTVCELRQEERGKAIAGKQLLTVREAEVLNWVEQGKSNGEIAQILNISHLTVKNHVQKILRKLDVHNRAQAVASGIRMNLIRGREQFASR